MSPRETEPVEPARRKRNATVTRAAILQSGLHAFCAHGYDGVGLRDIAKSAGVTAVLVNRYFGTKEELFAAAVESAFENDNPFKGDVSTLAARFSKMLVAKTDNGQESPDGLLLLLRSASNPKAAEILKASVARHFAGPLQSSLSGRYANVRAAMFLAQVAGFQLMRTVIKLDALTGADTRMLAALLAKVFEQQLEPAR